MTVNTIRPWTPKKETYALVHCILQILQQYEGMRLTLRQLYYQLVATNVIPNTEAEYKRLTGVVTRARYAGFVPWHCIEDRTRQPRLPNEFASVTELIKTAVQAYELDYWQHQRVRPEIWVEKEALSNIMEAGVRSYHAAVVVNRGYSSASSMYENAVRICRYLVKGQGVKIFYFGDHDPSGMDMVRDVKERIEEFLLSFIDTEACDDFDGDLHAWDEAVYEGFSVVHSALTDGQVEEYDPPPNPTKVTDSRAGNYISRYGRKCWELDALRPEVLKEIVVSAVKSCINDREMWDAVLDDQKWDIGELNKIAFKDERHEAPQT